MVRRLNPGTSPDLVQLFGEAKRAEAARAAYEPYFHPDFECIRHDLPGGQPHFGFDGLQAMYLDWLAPWVEYRTTVNEFIDCGDRVLTLQHSSGRLEGSTQEVTLDLATLWTVSDGKITRWEIYPSHGDALRAVGLDGHRAQKASKCDLVERWRESADAYLRGDFGAMMSSYSPDATWEGSDTGLARSRARKRSAALSKSGVARLTSTGTGTRSSKTSAVVWSSRCSPWKGVRPAARPGRRIGMPSPSFGRRS